MFNVFVTLSCQSLLIFQCKILRKLPATSPLLKWSTALCAIGNVANLGVNRLE